MTKDTSLIPHGSYCYNKDKVCTYWDLDEELAETLNTTQGCGYCHYMECSDADIVNNMTFNTSVPPNAISAFSLIWDQIKECGINKKEK